MKVCTSFVDQGDVYKNGTDGSDSTKRGGFSCLWAIVSVTGRTVQCGIGGSIYSMIRQNVKLIRNATVFSVLRLSRRHLHFYQY